MKKSPTKSGRPDIEAAVRGGDWSQPMDGEGPLAHATLKQARYWTHIYTEILAMEEEVLRRIQQLMAAQSSEARREVELTNVPVVIAQAERFRQRLGYWEARMLELDGVGSAQAAKALLKGRSGNQSAATTSPKPSSRLGGGQARPDGSPDANAGARARGRFKRFAK